MCVHMYMCVLTLPSGLVVFRTVNTLIQELSTLGAEFMVTETVIDGYTDPLSMGRQGVK